MVIFQAESVSTNESLLVIVIEGDNLKRMEKADPITLRSVCVGGALASIAHPDNLQVLLAFERDSGPVYEFLRRQDKAGLLRYLTRGFELHNTDKIPRGGGLA